MPPNEQDEQSGTVEIEQNTSYYVTEPDDEDSGDDSDTSPNKPNSE